MLATGARSGKRLMGYDTSSITSLSSDCSSGCWIPAKKFRLGSAAEKEQKMIASRFGKLMVATNGAPMTVSVTHMTEEDGGNYIGTGMEGMTVAERNHAKWDQLEYEMYLCKNLVQEYVNEETYGIPFDQIDEFEDSVKSEVCGGFLSVPGGMTKLFDHMRALLDVHGAVARGNKECTRFETKLLEEAVDTMNLVECQTHKSPYYGVGNDMKPKVKSDIDDGSWIGYGSEDSLSDVEMDLVEKAAAGI